MQQALPAAAPGGSGPPAARKKNHGAAPTSCSIGNGHSLNSLKNCLDRWVHFTDTGAFCFKALRALAIYLTQYVLPIAIAYAVRICKRFFLSHQEEKKRCDFSLKQLSLRTKRHH